MYPVSVSGCAARWSNTFRLFGAQLLYAYIDGLPLVCSAAVGLTGSSISWY